MPATRSKLLPLSEDDIQVIMDELVLRFDFYGRFQKGVYNTRRHPDYNESYTKNVGNERRENQIGRAHV